MTLRLYNAVYQKHTKKWTKDCKESDLGITKNYKGITINARATKVHNSLLLNCIKHEINFFFCENDDW